MTIPGLLPVVGSPSQGIPWKGWLNSEIRQIWKSRSNHSIVGNSGPYDVLRLLGTACHASIVARAKLSAVE